MNESRSTACTVPSSVSKRTDRSRTSSRLICVVRGSRTSRRPSPSRLNESEQRKIARPGIDREPRRLREVRLRVGEHHAPRRRRRLDAEAEERQHGLADDRRGNRHRRLHDQRRGHVRAARAARGSTRRSRRSRPRRARSPPRAARAPRRARPGSAPAPRRCRARSSRSSATARGSPRGRRRG